MKNVSFFLLFIATSTFSTGFTQIVYPNFVDGRLYVKTFDNSLVDLANPLLIDPALNSLSQIFGITKIERAFQTTGISISHVYRVEFNSHSAVENLINAFQQLPYIEYAEKAPIYQLSFTPNDVKYNQLYHLNLIDADQAWNIHKGESKVIVAVVDNGINMTHEDLVPNFWVNTDEIPNNLLDDDLNGYIDDYLGYDAADGDGNPNPPGNSNPNFAHGSHCAGIVSAKTNNLVGISSIGYQAQIMAIKATPNLSDGRSITKGYEGADYAMKNGAKVISMSFGGPSGTLTWEVLVRQAELLNILLVAAAGNENTANLNYPAAYPYVVSVGATDQNDQRAFFSNYGSTIDVMAPGVSILSTFNPANNGYGSLSGTSMACPMVAGLASLIFSYNPSLTGEQITQIIKNGCENISVQNPGFNDQLGSGRINAFRSMTLASGGVLADLDELNGQSFVIYPNPAVDEINFQFLTATEGQFLQIFDNQGRLIEETKIAFDGFGLHSLQLSLLGYEKGIYFARLSGENNSAQKFVVH